MNCSPFRSTWVHPRVLVGFVLLDLNFSSMFCRSLFVLLSVSLAIVLSVLLRYTDSDCPFGIFKLFLQRSNKGKVVKSPVIADLTGQDYCFKFHAIHIRIWLVSDSLNFNYLVHLSVSIQNILLFFTVYYITLIFRIVIGSFDLNTSNLCFNSWT